MPPFRLVIPRVLYEEMLAHARIELPIECCGLLAGEVVGGEGLVRERHTLMNELASPTEFRSEPRGMFAAMKAMGASGTEVLAVYHSHPNSPPVPSVQDRERNYSADVVNIIIGLLREPPEVRGWWLRGATAIEADWTMIEPVDGRVR